MRKMTITEIEAMVKKMKEMGADSIEFIMDAEYDTWYGRIIDMSLDVDFLKNDKVMETYRSF